MTPDELTLAQREKRNLKRKHEFEFVTGQYHSQNRGSREDLRSDAAREGYDSAEKFRKAIAGKKSSYPVR